MMLAYHNLSGSLGPQKGAVKPPEGTTPEGRAEALENQWVEARTKAQAPEYKGQAHAQGTDLPQSLDGPMVLTTMTEVGYYLDPKGWEWCTINHWLNGTPSEDDLGIGSSVKKLFTAQVLEDYCGDHAFGDQYEAAFEALKDTGAPPRLIKLLRERGQMKLDVKKAVFQKDVGEGLRKGAEDTLDAWKKYLIWAIVVYAGVNLLPALLKSKDKSEPA